MCGHSPENFTQIDSTDSHSHLEHECYKYAHFMDEEIKDREAEPLASVYTV